MPAKSHRRKCLLAILSSKAFCAKVLSMNFGISSAKGSIFFQQIHFVGIYIFPDIYFIGIGLLSRQNITFQPTKCVCHYGYFVDTVFYHPTKLVSLRKTFNFIKKIINTGMLNNCICMSKYIQRRNYWLLKSWFYCFWHQGVNDWVRWVLTRVYSSSL